MIPLHPSDFDAFYEEVNGHPPFPWQSRLLGQIAKEGWPELLDLPTGTGKTSAIDVAVFHLALEAARPPAERTAARRIALVVDRRVVVDQAHDRALALSEALRAAAEGSVTHRVAARLRSLTETGVPLATAVLRGGIVRDESWARTPDQPLVVVSTVDQVGSRLLFRGYGVSDSMRPVHAGLLGNDVLLLLDEVHLSTAFRDTLRRLAGYRRLRQEALPDRFRFVQMSATPGQSPAAGDSPAPVAFGLLSQDLAHPVLSQRLTASKLATLETAKVPRHDSEAAKVEAFAVRCAEVAWKHQQKRDIKTLGVVVNRVAAARRIAADLRARAGDAADVVLVTGRMRPLDRDDLWNGTGEAPVAGEPEGSGTASATGDRAASGTGLRHRVGTGRKRSEDDRPLFLVATQAIEAGADLDLDALVTECASIDALRQRFGRVDRLGALRESDSVILVRSDLVTSDDPVYGPALGATWQWLEKVATKGTVDLGVLAFHEQHGAPPAECLAPAPAGPPILPAHLDAWSQTRPGPSADPQPSFWLHGENRDVPEVQLVWRADVTPDLLAEQRRAEERGDDARPVTDRVQVCPPGSTEAVPVPLWSVRAWLRQRPGDRTGELTDQEAATADVEGGQPAQPGWRRDDRRGRPALRWRGDESAVCFAGGDTAADALRPGDTLVVPAAYGGLEAGVWSPRNVDTVRDLGDRVQWVQRARAAFRFEPAVYPAAGEGGWSPPVLPKPSAEEPEADREAITGWLDAVTRDGRAPEWMRDAAAALVEPAAAGQVRLRRSAGILRAGPGRLAVVSKRPQRAAERGDQAVVADEDTSPFTGAEIPLDAHCRNVADLARTFAEGLGLSPRLASDLALAGRLHDLGKADRRFQQMLRGGDPIALAVADAPVAKSAVAAADPVSRERARHQARWPRGLRHELTSVALAQASQKLRAQAHDWDLVLHLVASHHGWCRPLPAPVLDPAPVDVEVAVDGETVKASTAHGLTRLDGGIPDRYWRLVERYGWHGLAWLEAMVRLADHRQSEKEVLS